MRKILFFTAIVVIFSGCGILNPSIMFKTPKDFVYDKNPDTLSSLEYRISPNDKLDVRVFSNDGFKLIDLTSLNDANMGFRTNLILNYFVQADGNVKLPILGLRKLSGYTIREAQMILEEAYSSFYVNPFVIIQVVNRRVFVYPGEPGNAKVIPLENNNTTLIEAITLAGGISDIGKARKVKLVRQKEKKQEVYLMDLSTIKGVNQAKTILQANDIVYIEPRKKYSSKLLQEIAPIISLITSAFLVVALTKKL